MAQSKKKRIESEMKGSKSDRVKKNQKIKRNRKEISRTEGSIMSRMNGKGWFLS